MGKPVGSDLLQGTVTLPAMMLIERYPKDNPVKRFFEGGDRQGNIRRAIEMVRNSTIIQECFDVAAGYQKKAIADLNQLPDRKAREMLVNLSEFIVTRRR
jgi:geranylgeranyl pyrophosphate synthase